MIVGVTKHMTLTKVLACFALLGPMATLTGASKQTAQSSIDDHLIPIEGWPGPAFKELLTRKLYVTPANYARIVEFPAVSSEGEVSVAIYSRAGDLDGAFLTRTRGENTFWSAESGSDPNFSKDIKVVRCDAAFPKSTAVALHGAVKRMVDQSRPLENPHNTIILDARVTEFSFEDPQRGPVGGFLSPYASGKTGAALRRISRLLIEYCDSKPAKRASLAKRIEREAQRLK
jgi:hypothetical protein